MAAKDELGRDGEQRAVRHLTEAGYEVVDRNWRCPQGEIDIVAVHGDVLAIVEVKTRRTVGFGHPLEAIDARKARRLWQLAHAWAAAHRETSRGRTIRVEAIGIVGDPADGTVEHLEDVS